VKIVGLSDIGRTRTTNQDAYLIESKDNFDLLVVCDGMGGANAGEVASSLAIQSLRASFHTEKPLNPDAKHLTLWLETAILKANQDILSQAQSVQYHGMGTTIAAVLISPEAIVAGNVGDSRIYVLNQSNEFKQISEDHSLIHEMVKRGHISEEQAKHHPQRAVLTQVLGVHKSVQVDLFVIADDVKVLLVCSDGIHNMLEDQHLKTLLLKRMRLNAKVQAIVDAANAAGGLDNLTLIVAIKESAR